MITAPTPAHRDSRHAAIREALDRIDELLDPADAGRGLGAVLALVMPHARGLAAQARLALAARCVAQRIRQEAAVELLATAAPFLGQEAADPGRDNLGRRLRRKVRELRLVIELRLPGRLARANEGLLALAASTSLTDPLRGFLLTAISPHHVLDASLVRRLEALAPLLDSRRSPLGTLTARCLQLATCQPRSAGDRALDLFNAFATAQEELAAIRARLRHAVGDQDAHTREALERPDSLIELAMLSIGSTDPGPGQRHTSLCQRIAQALAGDCGRAVAHALKARDRKAGDEPEMLQPLMRAWSVVAHRGARLPGLPAPVPGHPAPPSPRLALAVATYFENS